MKFISFNVKYLVFVVYSIEYRLKGICKSLYFVFVCILHNVPTSLELGFVSPKRDILLVPVGVIPSTGEPPCSLYQDVASATDAKKTQKEGNLAWQHFVATDQKLAARYYCNDYLLPTSPLHYKGCALLFWYVFLYLFCPAASMYSSHLSPGIIINLHIKSVNTLFHRCYSWLCNKMLYSKSRNPGMQHVDCVETFHGIIVVEYLFSFKKKQNKNKTFFFVDLYHLKYVSTFSLALWILSYWVTKTL